MINEMKSVNPLNLRNVHRLFGGFNPCSIWAWGKGKTYNQTNKTLNFEP